MSFWNTVVDIGKSAIGLVTGNSIGSTLLKTVVSGYALNRLTKNVNQANVTEKPAPVDPGVRLQVQASQDQKIPVAYGSAQLGGIITEAVMSNNNTRMTYVFTICELTGTKLSDDQASSFTFEDVYWNDQRMVFATAGAEAGIVAAYSVDRDGNRDYSVQDLVRVYCYNGDSASGVVPDNYTNASVPDAYTVVPNWTTAHIMSDLIFAVVQVNYNNDKGITRLPDMRFHVTNSMTLPGDCLLDYMTSTRYGAGIPIEGIYDE
jgi:hypothetical protein